MIFHRHVCIDLRVWCILGACSKSHWIIEQPGSSLLPYYAPLQVGVLATGCILVATGPTQDLIKRHKAKFYYLNMGMMGGPTQIL